MRLDARLHRAGIHEQSVGPRHGDDMRRRQIETEAGRPLLSQRRAELIHTITGARTVVFGHTHLPLHQAIGPVMYLNGGSWSPAFREPDCQTRIGTQTFVWIRPQPGGARQAGLYEWPPGGSEALAASQAVCAL